MRGQKLTAWEHVKSAHSHLLLAYSMIDFTQFYADTLNRALRNAALAMGQMPVALSKKPALDIKESCRTAPNTRIKRGPKRAHAKRTS
jgi:hypothetical protein